MDKKYVLSEGDDDFVNYFVTVMNISLKDVKLRLSSLFCEDN